MQGRQVGEPVQPAADVGVDHDRLAELLATVDDPVAGGVERPEVRERPGQVALRHLPDRGQVGPTDDLVGIVDQPQLQARRSGVDDQHPHVTTSRARGQ